MSTQGFRDAVVNASQRPKGVSISPNLFQQPRDEEAISTTPVTLWGLPTETFKFDLPAFDDDIYVREAPSLDGDELRLPPSSL